MINRSDYYSADELAEKAEVSSRTIRSRLRGIRKNPKAYVLIVYPNKIKQYLYKKDFVDESILKRVKRTCNKQDKVDITYLPPPVYVYDKNGNRYNLFAVKALLRVLEDNKLLTAFMAMHIVVLIGTAVLLMI